VSPQVSGPIRSACHPELPRNIVYEQLLPFWLDMERTLEAYRTGDRAMLLWNVLQSHQTRTYEQASTSSRRSWLTRARRIGRSLHRLRRHR